MNIWDKLAYIINLFTPANKVFQNNILYIHHINVISKTIRTAINIFSFTGFFNKDI